MDRVLRQVRIPMDDPIARTVVWFISHVAVKSRFLYFGGLIFVVAVFHLVVFEAV